MNVDKLLGIKAGQEQRPIPARQVGKPAQKIPKQVFGNFLFQC